MTHESPSYDVRAMVTHSGSFHADDVFSASVMRRLAPHATLTRTRDPDVLIPAVQDPHVVVFDVGDAYDPAMNNFDHHQRSFDVSRESGLPLASIGLIWMRYGESYVESVLRELGLFESTTHIARIVERVTQRVILALDAADCGQLSGGGVWRKDEAVELHTIDLSSLVGLYHPTPDASPQAYDAAFERAMVVAQTVLSSSTQRAHAYFAAADSVEAADDGGPLLIFDTFCPWYAHAKDHHLFVVSPSKSGKGWMVETVQDDFVARCPLPKAWAGHRDEALQEVSGIGDAIFCHRAQFIGAAQSKEGALAMVERALAMHKP